ncbi:MAG: manganese efflux pump MntP family protein [Candidatus Omnitrophota bacterium]
MSFVTIFFIAIGLSMDACAVSIVHGIAMKKFNIRHAAIMALFFGAFQAIMPVIGWLGGCTLRGFIQGVDHWIAFSLLAFVGGKMIFESTKLGDERKAIDFMSIYTLLILSLATSIDALAVGLSLSFLNISIIFPALVIGATTFTISLGGVLLGNRFGHFFERKMEFAGGLILIAIGVKILIEHLK